MARYTPTPIGSGYNSTASINAELDKVEAAIGDTLSRVGDAPNTMSTDIDMNSNQILNLQPAVTGGEPITLSQGLDSLNWTLQQADAKFYDTVVLATVDTSLVAGNVVIIKERASAIFDVISGTGTANGFDIVAHATLNLSFSLRRENSLNVLTLGAVRDGTTQTSVIQRAIDIQYDTGGLSLDGAFVYIPKGVVVDVTLLALKDNVTLQVDDGQTLKVIMNGQNVSGAVNEQWNVAGYHPSYNLDAHDDYTGVTLGTGQVLGYRCSFLYRINGAGNWQVAQDINNVKDKHLTFFALNPSQQVLNLHHNGKIRYGRRTSIQDFSDPPASHSFNENVLIQRDIGQVVTFQMRTVTAGVLDSAASIGVRKLFQLQTSGELSVLDNLAANFIFRFKDSGTFVCKKGVTGSSYTTSARNALTGWAANEVGTMVFDSTLGKPIWLKATTPVWVDATGATV